MSRSSQEIANAVIERLQEWCLHLFWITVVCVIKFCEDEEDGTKKKKMLTASDVAHCRRMREIENKVLYHLTSSKHQPVHRFVNVRQFSKPPSLELFSIAEE